MGSDISQVRAHRALLDGFVGRRKWAEALVVARRLVELEPQEGDHRFWVGRCLELTGNHRSALDAYEDALVHSFSDPELATAARVGRDRLRGPVEVAEKRKPEEELGKRRRAEALAAAASLPSFATAVETASRARDTGDVELALAAADRAIDLVSSYGERGVALTVRGASLRRMGRVTEAVKDLREAILLDPSPSSNFRAFTALVAALREAGHFTEAVQRSWLNQIEIYFSILQRKLLQPNDFADAASLERAILDFERYYAGIAEPFQWRCTRAHLNLLLARVASEQTVLTGPAAPLLLAA